MKIGFCDFVVLSQCDLDVERIHPDEKFVENMIEKLVTFMKYAKLTKSVILIRAWQEENMQKLSCGYKMAYPKIPWGGSFENY